MALNKLSEKLDQVTEQELGIDFDSTVVWSKLEQRLDNRKAHVYWWVVAASVLLGLLLFPISLLKESVDTTLTISQFEEVPIKEVVPETALSVKEESVVPKRESKSTMEVQKIGTPLQYAKVSKAVLILEPLQVTYKKENKSTFDAKDISIIQASLERPSIEKGKNISIRAQLPSFPNHVKSNKKVVKIKLYEKH